MAESGAQAKARRLGIADEKPSGKEAERAHDAERTTVALLGRPVFVVSGKDYALDHNNSASPASVQSYIARAFGHRLPEVRRAMEHLALSAARGAEQDRVPAHEHVRPEVPDDVREWGAKGVLRLDHVLATVD